MVKEGYKQTEIGLIPEDWIIEPLENFLSFISYGFTNPMPTVTDGIFMITARDVNDGKIIYENARKTSIIAYKQLLTAKSKPIRNDLLLTKDGSLGRLALVSDIKICINQSVALLRPININPKFLQCLLESKKYQKKMLDDAGGSTIKHIYITVVNKMLISVPCNKKEQKAIAKALSDTDELISSLEKLISKKEAIMQGTMQQLLTARKRLSGFSGEWEEKSLEEVANISRGASPRPIEDPKWFDNNSDIGWVRISDISKTTKFLNETVQKLSQDGISKSRFVKKDNLIMSICATLGKPILTKLDTCIHDGFVVFNNLQIDKEFLYYFLFFIEKDWSKSGQTGSQMNLNTELINSTTILLPPTIKEQQAIVEILSDMDNEIESLKSKLAKTKAIKDGIMSELLTGKTRLKVKDE